jgi:hypothetical protein
LLHLTPWWNHIHLQKSGDFICHGIPVHSSSCPVTECPPVRDSPLWIRCGTTSTCAKGENWFAVLFFSGHSAAQLEYPPVRDSQMWNHIHLHKSGNFICQFLYGHTAAQLKYPPDKEVSLWNHIHLQKSGDFICHGIPVHSSSCPVKECPPVRDSSLLIQCGTTSTCAKGAILFAVVFFSGHSATPVGVSCRQSLATDIRLRKRTILFSMVILPSSLRLVLFFLSEHLLPRWGVLQSDI